MEDLLEKLGCERPGGDEDDVDRKTELAIACIAATKPDMSDVEVAACIARAFVEEHPDCYSDVLVDNDALTDVVNAGEAKKIAESTAISQAVKAKKSMVMDTRDRKLHKYFKKTPQPKFSASQKKVPRWLPSRDETNTSQITDWIMKHGPSSTSVVCDDYNGRWRVISANLDWRSISWTKRGYQQAAFEVLRQAWLYHQDYTGHKCPFDMSSLEKKWEDVAATS
jgi:hypothetical protein